MQKSQERLDLDCALYIAEDIHELELQAAAQNDYTERRHAELWSLRSWNDDEHFFPHGSASPSWCSALCQELSGLIGRPRGVSAEVNSSGSTVPHSL